MYMYTSGTHLTVHLCALTDPVTIQLFRTTNLAALTGRSVTSKDFTKD